MPRSPSNAPDPLSWTDDIETAALGNGGMPDDAIQKNAGLDPESDRVDARQALPSLKLADLGAVKRAAGRRLILREAEAAAEEEKVATEYFSHLQISGHQSSSRRAK
jgi:hypothetical protein